MSVQPANIAIILKMLPHSPGVYRFLDASGTVIYVGKAKDLKARVSQYFRSGGLNRKTQVMVSRIADIQHTVVGSESDAFLLENNLIKKYQPRYNILLKDGKTYPWICVESGNFPRVTVTRRFVRNGSRYFGPYSSAMHAHGLLELINSLYRLRTCRMPITAEGVAKGKYKVCLDYHLGRCAGPCVGKMSEAEYGAQIDATVQILKGNSYSLIKDFERRMNECAAALKFEEAQIWKERLDLLQKHYAKSFIVNAKGINVDVFHVLFEGQDAFGSFLRVHDGCIVQSLNMEIRMRIEEDEASVLGSFISGIYGRLEQFGDAGDSPSEIVVPFMPDMPEALPGVTFTVPEKGDRLALLELGRKNAAALKFERLKHEEFVNPEEHSARIVENLRRDLGMEELPVHIECFDNSNIQGTNPVASCVVFRDGAPSKKDYRHFNIKTVVGANDFASMKEVVNRRYSRLLSEGEELPQLIVIDGGRGQVNAAYEALDELGLIGKVRLIGLAKRMEEIIVPGDPYPHFIDRNSTSLRVLMHIRDEAHRFGITHHRNRRSTSSLVSELDNIPGVGAVSREKLVAKYRTMSRIKKAPYREVVNVIGRRSADSLFTWLGLEKS
ncbi:MAG TPA: excinuclease ABC subunit UvrC [Candidatus Coprenecus pullistercoris]|nr:excinuclease ABC subunit UvrC [Candidatus Coprenecus pullistercoris]